MAPVLKTDSLMIRPFERKDLAAFTRYRAQPDVARYQSWTEYTYRDAVTLFERMDYTTFGTTGNWYQLAIADEKTDVLLGDLAVHFIDDAQVEIGFTVDPQYQRKNIAFHAVNRLLDYLFDTLNRNRVIAVTDADNRASSRLLEKLAFRREGHFRQNIFFKGAWGDEYLYAMLNADFHCR
ncbi:GNAT family N-acetyltransferase [Photobacterium halotolerans]|nr:GNAT family protein [Photobacterium halotolerans]